MHLDWRSMVNLLNNMQSLCWWNIQTLPCHVRHTRNALCWRQSSCQEIDSRENLIFIHNREVSLSLQFPEFSVWYWGSFTQQRGFELSLGSGYLETTYGLTLQEYSDGLVRRPAANWSAAKLRSELLDVTCHLYGLEEVDGKESGDEYAEVLNQSLYLFSLFPNAHCCVSNA